jgi:hypothetical protein
MPIDSLHPEYVTRAPQWIRCRDVIEGSDVIKNKGVSYLPKLLGQTNAEYLAYKKRALFFSVSGRSLSGLVGMLIRRQPTVTKTPQMDKYFEDSSHGHMSFSELISYTANEVLMVGRVFILIDWPSAGGDPYITTYNSECVINWSVDDAGTLQWLVIKEQVVDPTETDPFDQTMVDVYRHIRVEDGAYTIDTYDDTLTLISSVSPTVSGAVLDRIPGVMVTPSGVSMTLEKPPILDIVDVNLSQYMTSADLEHGRHFTALPTPVVSGVNMDTELKIGSQTAWAIPEKAKAYYLEFQGSGLNSLEKAMGEKTSQMAQFSTRLMDTSSRGSEAADTVRLRHSGEAATLSGVAYAIESAMNIIYGTIAELEDLGDVNIDLNKDFLDTRLSHADLRELTASLVSGAIDEETYFYNLERGEIVPQHKERFDSKVVRSDTNGESSPQPQQQELSE